jgi:hypothetical protein
VFRAICRTISAVLLASMFSAQLASAAVQAGDAAQPEGFGNDPRILRGLTEVSVSVATLDPWLLSHQVTKAQLKAAALQKLAATGIKVLPEPPEKQLTNHMSAMPSVPVLFIRMKSVSRPDTNGAAYSVQVSLVDSVVTKRHGHQILVSVWDITDVGQLQSNMSTEAVAGVNQQLDALIKDWKAANASKITVTPSKGALTVGKGVVNATKGAPTPSNTTATPSKIVPPPSKSAATAGK